jgi:molecular chaperone GrpE (heat shock protein)
MDNNLDQLLFSESNGNNNSEQPKTQQNERIAYENIDPLEILIRITQKANEISEKAGQISEFQDSILDYKNDMEDFNNRTTKNSEIIQVKHDSFIQNFNANADYVINKIGAVQLSINKNDLNELRQVHQVTEILTKAYNEKELKIVNFFNRLKYWILGSFALLIILNIITGNLARIWYKTSVQTKLETRAELLDEIKKSGKGIYEIEHIEDLERNTKIIQSWRKTAPKSSVDNFDTFMDGYFAKEK